jgi:hypothetical protein
MHYGCQIMGAGVELLFEQAPLPEPVTYAARAAGGYVNALPVR